MTERRSQQTQTCGDQALHSIPRTVSTKGIKDFVSKHLPVQHPLRLLISSEKAELTVEEFRIKLDDWLTLFNYKS